VREATIWSDGMATCVAAEEAEVKGAALRSARATAPPTQQTPIPHPWSLWEGAPFMSSGQHSSIDIDIDMPSGVAICMVECVSAAPMADAAADVPTGRKASEAAMANARMVRTSRIAP
jgi:hypothetical protein